MAFSKLFLTAFILNCAGSIRAENWPTWHHDQQRTANTSEQLKVQTLHEAWRWNSAQPPETAWTAPARWDAYAFIRNLRAMRDYDAAFQPIVVNERLYFGSSIDDAMHCLDLNTGNIVWQFIIDAPIRVAPTFAQDNLYFGSDDGFAYCLSAKTGKMLWKYKPFINESTMIHNGRMISRWPCRSGVAVDQNVTYCAFSLLPWQPSYLCAIDANSGKPIFERKLPTGHTLEGSLILSKESIIATQGRIGPVAFRRKDGASLGMMKKGGGGSFQYLLSEKHLLHGPGNKTGWLTISDLNSKKPVATFETRTAAVADGSILYFLSDTTLAAFDRQRNRVKWEVKVPHSHEIILAGDTLFVGQNDQVSAHRKSDGKLFWQSKVQGRARGIVVANGALIVSTDDGIIHCFREGSTVKPVPSQQVTANRQSPRRIETINDKSLLHRWMFHEGMSAKAKRRGLPNASQRVQDLASGKSATILGQVQIRREGSIEALELDGSTNSIQIATDHNTIPLPAQEMTIEAWVRIDKPLTWGGILGAIQDNGNFERGWLLGYRGEQFCFGLSTKNGPGRLTYLNAKTKFELGQWYHVVGVYDGKVQQVFVNGKLAASATEQKGDIHYPPQAFVEMGAYHDKDEYFRMTGMIHEVRVYQRPLTGAEIQRNHQARARRFPIPIHLKMGPYAEFINQDSAIVRWETETPSPTILDFGQAKLAQHYQKKPLTTKHEMRVDNLRRNRIYTYFISTLTEGKLGTTPRFELDTHFNYTVPKIQGKNDQKYVDVVKKMLKGTKATKGICLVMGAIDGRFALEIARQSEMRVIIVDEDAQRIERIRKMLSKAGVYGWRITAHTVKSLNELPYPSNFANVIVSEREMFPGSIKERTRLLRPSGGISWICRSEKIEHKKDKLPGSGEWSHLYGLPDNSAFGGETLAGVKSTNDLQVQWMGKPGPRAQPDRSGRKPSPLSVNGRLFVQGLHRLIALDAYNGTLLWEWELPTLERFNMPRDCSNWCADDDYVYVAMGSHCWQLDAQTGRLIKVHEVTVGNRKDWNYDWSYLARMGEQLIGSAVKMDTAFTNFWGDANHGWYDAVGGPATFNVCSENLFARDLKSGKNTWHYPNGVILNSTITITPTRVYFVECRNNKVKASNSRRVGMSELWDDQYLIALDLDTGKKVYERPLKTEKGIVVFYLAHGDGRLVLASSSNKRYDVYAFDAATGKREWHQQFGWFKGKGDHGKAMSRPAIVNNRVYVRPGVMDLSTGKLLPVSMPQGGCGTYAATENLFIFRNSNITVWDTNKNTSTSWNRLRPGCWLSTIPAGGMLLSPEAGGGCSCGSWMETSIGFAPKHKR